MRTPVSSLAAACAALLATCTVAAALDQPIAGQTLKLTAKNGKQKLVFISKDAGALFPAIGGADDPAAVGTVVDVAPAPGAGGTLTLPAGGGKPGWTAKPGITPSYKFENKLAPAGISGVQVAIFKQGKQLKIIAKSLGGASFSAGTSQVGIRITTGGLRNCALFGPGTLHKANTEAVSASKAPAAALANCSDTSIGLPSGCQLSAFPTCGGPCDGEGEVCTGGLGDCHCVGPNTPCGASHPTCGGVCPTGETCAATGPDYPRCVCIPEGATPCGTPGVPTCGGACPGDEACLPAYGLPIFGGPLGCACGSPAGCGAGGLGCGNGFACGQFGGNSICAPIACDGTYPTCGGACGDGGECQAIDVNNGSFTACVCAVPAPCDTCGGYTCPSGQVCGVDPGTCGCQ